MKERFKQIETRLRHLIEESAAKLLASQQAEQKLASQLAKAMQDHIRLGEDGGLQAPNIYTIAVHPAYAQDVGTNHALLESLARDLQQAGEQHGVSFPSPPTIAVSPDPFIPEGEFQVRATRSEESLAETQGMEAEEEQRQERIPPKAFLIVGGSKIFSLEVGVVNIGRKLDNHLVIDDPRVSRRHAQLRAVRGRFMVFDLESSGGTFVNGERVTRMILHPGDVISLAGVPLVYGQDAARSAGETQEYVPPSRTREDHTTDSYNQGHMGLDKSDH